MHSYMIIYVNYRKIDLYDVNIKKYIMMSLHLANEIEDQRNIALMNLQLMIHYFDTKQYKKCSEIAKLLINNPNMKTKELKAVNKMLKINKIRQNQHPR